MQWYRDGSGMDDHKILYAKVKQSLYRPGKAKVSRRMRFPDLMTIST